LQVKKNNCASVKEEWGKTTNHNKEETIILPHLISRKRVQASTRGKTATINLFESKEGK